MAARDGAASIQGEVIRITPLNIDGSIDATKPVLTTEGFISASFAPEFEDGEEITEKAANGKICIQYKTDDSMKGITFNLSLCSPDPEAAALLAGGKVIVATADETDKNGVVVVRAGEIVGYSSPKVGDIVGNPVAVEIWSKAIVNGKPAAGTPYWHWVFPYVRVRYDGDREFSNGALANQFSGTGVGNEALVTAGLNPGTNEAQANPATGTPADTNTVTDDFVTYKAALVNPFSYVRSASKPLPGWSGSFTPTPANAIGAPLVATGGGGAVTAGPDKAKAAPGDVFPADTNITASDATNAAKLAGLSYVAAPATKWTAGQQITVGTFAFSWDGTAWAAGAA